MNYLIGVVLSLSARYVEITSGQSDRAGRGVLHVVRKEEPATLLHPGLMVIFIYASQHSFPRNPTTMITHAV